MTAEPTFLGLNIGDWATWVSAAGTFSAVALALWMARRDTRRNARESYARGKVIASFLFTEVGLIDKGVEEALRHVVATKALRDERAMTEISLVKEIVSRMDMNKISANLDKLVYLPGNHGQFLAAAPDMKRVLLTMLTFPSAFPLPHDAHSIADMVLPQLRAMKANTDAFLAEFLPQFAT